MTFFIMSFNTIYWCNVSLMSPRCQHSCLIPAEWRINIYAVKSNGIFFFLKWLFNYYLEIKGKNVLHLDVFL